MDNAAIQRRRRAAVVAIAVALAAVLEWEAASANPTATFGVNSTSDALDGRIGDGACATSSGMCTLRAAIQEANALPGDAVIQVPAGTYEIAIPPLNQNDITTGDLDITDSLTITGAGAAATIIDAGIPTAGAPPQVHGLDRIFEVAVDGGTVGFSGLTIRDGYAAEYGGAIANNSTANLSVTASVLTNNVAGKAGGAIDNHLAGGVHVRDSTVTGNFAYETGSALNNNRDGALTVTDSTVSSNSATAVGLDEALVGAGAIANNAELDTSGTITVTGSQISDNRAGGGRSGATISNDGTGTVVVDATTFTKNIATGDGGAIFNGAGEVTVSNSTFSENAARDGGAIYASVKDGRVTVSGSTFSLNSATARGGAIASSGTGVLTVLDSAFTKNSADDWGGAILNDDKGSATILGSTFHENSGLDGGGFANEGTGLVTVENSTFTKNSALAGLVLASGEGGGMHTNSVGEVVITGGAFTENTARSGGGLSNEGGGTLSVTGTRFTANHADEQGGGILIQSGAVRMLDIDVVGNAADSSLESGGGIAYQGDKLVSIGESAAIEHSRIRDNKAKGPGGGVDSRGDGPLTITTTAITGNTGAMGGGIHHVGDAPLDVTRSTLSGNFAEGGGGVFSDGDGEASIENTTVSGNRAGQFGGGLLVSSRLTLLSSTVANNSAASGGGINNGGGDLVGDGSVFLTNTIVANSPTGGNCVGTMTSLGGNLESADTCQFRELSDQPGTDPRLGPLADNGGPTQTHALLAESPGQERAVCTELDPCPPVDQRGLPRPLFVGVDVGAYESELAPGGGGGQPCAGLSERPLRADFDSWVAQSAPVANFGSDATLKVESNPGANDRALVHFTLPTVPPGCKLVGATLRLYSPSATDGHKLEALRVESGWSEGSVNWDNQPAAVGPAAMTQSGVGLVEWDVLAQTRDMYTLGAHGFLIRDAEENGMGEQSFHSREKGADRPPELVLVFDDPDAPPQPAECPTTPQSLSADQDSWVNEGSPSNNFGTDSTLKVKSQGGSQIGNNARALVRFPLPALPAGCTSIASATLRMEAASAKDGRTLEALQVAAPWDETGVTWSNQPVTTGGAADVPSAEGALEWSVTAQMLDIYTSANHGFLIRDAEENGIGDEQTLHSRDKLNDSPPELVIIFDDSTPETTIDSGPDSPTDAADAEFSFSSDYADATFECSLDGSAFRACTSPDAVDGLAEGDHRFEVRSTRKVRAVDPTPASYDWRVAVPPETNVSGPASPSASASATLTFSADDPDATFECSLNGVDFAACTSPVEYKDLPDGEQEFRVRAIDRLGNADPSPAVHAWTVAVPPTVTLTSVPADPSNDPTPSFEFSGTDNGPAPPALEFACSLDGVALAACVSGIALGPLADGNYTFEVQASDAAGNAATASYMWTVDTTAPELVLTSVPANPSNDATPSFEYSSEPGAKIDCSLDGIALTDCASPVTLGPLAHGSHTFELQATDPATNSATASYMWTVDTTAPELALTSVPADPSNDPTPAFEFTSEPGATVTCSLDGIALTDCVTLGPLTDGSHALELQATDAAGNTATASYTWTVDTTAPQLTLTSVPSDPSNDPTPSFEFTSEPGATVTCNLDGIALTDCASPVTLGPLAAGTYAFELTATDAAANTATASYTWTIDTTAPELVLTSVPADPSNDATPSFEYSSEPGAKIDCSLDGIALTDCASLGPLADGGHTFELTASDAAGNAASVSYSWTVDTTAPELTLTSVPADPSNDATPSFEYSSEPGATVTCNLDGIALTDCASPVTLGPLADGGHTFELTATDAAANTATVSYSWTVDTTAPELTLTSVPADPSNDPTPAFEFTGEPGATVTCSLDEIALTDCVTLGPLTDGSHTLELTATDAAGNTATASYTWTIDTTKPDTTPPDTTLTDQPADPSRNASASFSFSGSDNDTPAAMIGFECRLDSQGPADFGSCTSPHTTAPQADGSHTFEVRAVDAAGNTDPTPASYTWTVDTTAPETTIDSAPASPTNDATPTYEFSSEPDATFECRVDTDAFAACTSPHTTAALTDGDHTFQVRATDAAGNTDATAASRAITVDTTAPQTTIDSGPAGPTNDATPTYAFSSEQGATFECRVDADAFAACTSPHTAAALTDGAHTFQVRATDAAGNEQTSPASRAINVDTSAPQTTITGAPPATTSSTSGTFTFTASEPGATLECSLDGAAFTACASPRDYSGLALGAHAFGVRAKDAAGNTDATPATHSWTITAPPQGCGPAATALSVADAWIDENSPSSNKGADSILKVQSKGPRDNFRALVRFAMPAVPQGCMVQSATLRLYAASARTGRTLQALRLAGPWTEDQVNWSNQPETAGAAAVITSGQGYREWDVTSHVQAIYGSSNHGFLIRDAVEGQDAEQQFHSVEKGENPPQLVLRFAPSGG